MAKTSIKEITDNHALVWDSEEDWYVLKELILANHKITCEYPKYKADHYIRVDKHAYGGLTWAGISYAITREYSLINVKNLLEYNKDFALFKTGNYLVVTDGDIDGIVKEFELTIAQIINHPTTTHNGSLSIKLRTDKQNLTWYVAKDNLNISYEIFKTEEEATSFINYKLEYVTVHGIRLTHGTKISCKLDGTFIENAEICYSAETVSPKHKCFFICQDILDGSRAVNKLGYRYSWVISKDNHNYIKDLNVKSTKRSHIVSKYTLVTKEHFIVGARVMLTNAFMDRSDVEDWEADIYKNDTVGILQGFTAGGDEYVNVRWSTGKDGQYYIGEEEDPNLIYVESISVNTPTSFSSTIDFELSYAQKVIPLKKETNKIKLINPSKINPVKIYSKQKIHKPKVLVIINKPIKLK